MTELSLPELQAKINSEQWPVVSALDYSDGGKTVSLQLSIPDSLTWFAGHFPEQPVLPGVVQLDWAAQIVNWVFTINHEFQRVDSLKFNNMILPLTELDLRLTLNTETSVAFRYQNADLTFSSGKLIFAS